MGSVLTAHQSLSSIDDSTASFGPQLQRLRTARKLSQQQLADAAGVSRGQISELETGKALPRLDVLYRLARGLNVPTSSLLVAEQRLQAAGWETLARRLPLSFEQAQTLRQLLESDGVAETASPEDALLRWMTHTNVLP